MNGRCTTDPLDRAEDICEACGEQFCSLCLLFPRGRRQPPTCKACALANSGLRGSGSASKGISKREWKKRRKQLEEDLTDVVLEEPAIEYFDLQEPEEKPETRPSRAEPAPIPEPIQAESSPLGSIRLADPTPGEPTPPQPEPVTNGPDPVPAGLVYEPTAVLPDMPAADVSVNPLAFATEPTAPSAAPTPLSVPPVPAPLVPQAPTQQAAHHPSPLNQQPAPPPALAPQEPSPPPTPVSATESAADLLAKLKANEPIRSQYHAGRSALDLEADPFSGVPSSQPDPFGAAPLQRPSDEPPTQQAPHDAPPLQHAPPHQIPADNNQPDPFAPSHQAPAQHPAAQHTARPPRQPQSSFAHDQRTPLAEARPAPTSKHVDPFAEFDEQAVAASPPTPATPPVTPQADPTPAWTPPTPPPRGTNTDDMAPVSPPADVPPAAAPAAPAPSPIPPALAPAASLTPAAPPAAVQAAAPAPAPIRHDAPAQPSGLSFNNASAQPRNTNPAKARPAAPSAAPDATRAADTDANGNWIPPNLRGMAAPSKSGETELPKRRRTD